MGPTQEDVAKKAKVSRALVSLVMRGAPNVSEQRRRRVLRAAEELGYRPNAYARSLASKRLHTIGVLINDVTNPYFGGVYSSLAAAAEEAGFDLLVAPGTRSAAKESALVRTLLEHRVAGLALLSPIMPTEELRSLTASWPTVLIGRDASIAGVDVVTTDEQQAARLVLEHLTGLGHRDIVHITGGVEPAGQGPRQGLPRRRWASSGSSRARSPGAFTHEAGQDGGRGRSLDDAAAPDRGRRRQRPHRGRRDGGLRVPRACACPTTSAWSATTTPRSPASTWCSSPASARASTSSARPRSSCWSTGSTTRTRRGWSSGSRRRWSSGGPRARLLSRGVNAARNRSSA